MSDTSVTPQGAHLAARRALWPRTIRPWLRSCLNRSGLLPREGTLSQQLEAADLPPSITALLTTTIKSTRLSRREQQEIAAELVTHFQDGLEAGRSEEDLIRTFGDARATAIMLRNATLNKRTPLQKFARRLGQGILLGLGLVIGTYLIALLIFAAGKPTISVPYALNYNKQVEAIPTDQRAYPLYVEVLKQIQRPPSEIETSPVLDSPEKQAEHDRQAGDDQYFNTFPQRANYPSFAKARAWLDGHSEAMNLLHRASKLPRAGVPFFADKFDSPPATTGEQPRYFTPERYTIATDPEADLFGVLLPMLVEYRFLARCTILDARIAIQDKDVARGMRALETQIGLVRHSREDETLIGQLVGLAILQIHHNTVEEVIASGLLDDAKLQSLLQQHAAIAGATLTPTFTREKEFFNDFLQRSYTDDGKGGGRMTKEGLLLLERYSSAQWTGGQKSGSSLGLTAFGPLSFVTMAGRSELRSKYEGMIDEAHRLAKLAPADRFGSPAWTNPFPEEKSAMGKLRYAPIAMLFPALHKSISTFDRVRLRHEAITMMLQIERQRLASGAYPTALSEMKNVAAPVDYFAGQPIRYVLIDKEGQKRPVLYALGPDRKDDQGRRPFKSGLDDGLASFKLTTEIDWQSAGSRAASRGDAILVDPYRAAGRLSEEEAREAFTPPATSATTP